MSASEQTREARDQVLGLSSCDHADGECALCAEAITAYAAAIRADTLADAIRCVEDLMSWSSKHDGGPWTDKDDALEALTRLRALEVDNGAQGDE